MTVASLAHKRGSPDFGDLNSETDYDPWAAYRRSKLGDLVFALELQRRLRDAGEVGTISVAAHPGWTQTELSEDLVSGSTLKGLAVKAVWPLVAMDTWRGALPTLVASTSSHVRPGDYIGPSGLGEVRGDPARAVVSAAAADPSNGERLWKACEEMTGVTVPLGGPGAA